MQERRRLAKGCFRMVRAPDFGLSPKRQHRKKIMVSKNDEENSKEVHKGKSKSLVQPRTFKVVVIGDMSVGKTCLVWKLCSGTFPDITESTIGVDFRERSLVVEGETVKVLFLS